MNKIICLNGNFMPVDQACISPDDRGFYFADGIYEVIKFYRGKGYGLPDHWARLQRSLAAVRITFPLTDQVEEMSYELLRLNRMEKEYAAVYLQVTRGASQRMHRFPDAGVSPTLYMHAYLMPPFVHELTHGIKVILREDIRWHRCDIKSVMLLPNVLMYQEAVENGSGECFFIRDGFFTESTHSNIFGVKEGSLFTHPDSNLVLPGITKKAILRICKNIGIPVRETPIKASATSDFDEFFISGTGSEVMPVIQLENIPVGDGRPGMVTRRIQQEFFRETYGEMADDWEFRKWK